MPQLNYTRHGLTTHKKYKCMVAWGWDVPRLIVRYEVIHATKDLTVNLDWLLMTYTRFYIPQSLKGKHNQLRYARLARVAQSSSGYTRRIVIGQTKGRSKSSCQTSLTPKWFIFTTKNFKNQSKYGTSILCIYSKHYGLPGSSKYVLTVSPIMQFYDITGAHRATPEPSPGARAAPPQWKILCKLHVNKNKSKVACVFFI